MGGTSTDVSRFANGKYEHVVESTTAGVTIQAPQLDINTVAAGGGSMLFFRSGLFVVGPESAGKLRTFKYNKCSMKSVIFFYFELKCKIIRRASWTSMLSERGPFDGN